MIKYVRVLNPSSSVTPEYLYFTLYADGRDYQRVRRVRMMYTSNILSTGLLDQVRIKRFAQCIDVCQLLQLHGNTTLHCATRKLRNLHAV